MKDEAAHALKHLGGWAKRTKHSVPIVAQPAQAWTEPQPLGAVLIIAPWNYPLQLLLAPAVAALAAGNAMVLKPSELAPATSAAVADLVPRYLDPEAVVGGRGRRARDHRAARPAVGPHPLHRLHPGRAGGHGGGGQAPHPGHARAGRQEPDDHRRRRRPRRSPPSGSPGPRSSTPARPASPPTTCWSSASVSESSPRLVVDELAGFRDKAPPTSIVNEHHIDRLEGLLEGHGGEELLPRKTDRDTRVMAPVVVREPDPTSAVMQEEIFGPILPLITVDSIDEAISFIKARPRPLALYLFTSSGDTERKVLDQTHAGSVCINHLVYQAAVTSLPFGGIGPSGMGAYHGKAGFDTFSHHKSVLKRPTRMDPGFAYPPYPAQMQKILKAITRW